MIEVNNTVLGLVAAAVPLLIIGFFILRRLPWIFAFFVALLAVGLGYLETTGAVRDFGHKVRTVLPEGVLKNRAHEAEPAAGPAMAPASPPAEQPATTETPPANPPAAEPATPAPETPPAQETTPAPAPTPPANTNQTEPAPSQSPPATTP
ncbi:hypothetical protein HYPDE_37858 [Hyphomicrobium denitrificans 1NES1]|uniref:Uncharacterized protein n=1 Tax=Hyphomicrobium denitrificans 1NES1 TaxID=670307 RepID=N0B885_9HYPH|nr:hypothetical protein [Hyphomicrobium denitrificans]AGK59243.1 hypothetical protein HYPDE_37858 [Hyphomicrobium denitrificans 1NES1]